jgi:valyl-tRNA synthetase
VLLAVCTLFAPILPFVTDEIYRGLFAPNGPSIHRVVWPAVDPSLIDDEAEEVGGALVEIATAVRRYKSDRSLSLGASLPALEIVAGGMSGLREGADDLMSVTRTEEVRFVDVLGPGVDLLYELDSIAAGVRGVPAPS